MKKFSTVIRIAAVLASGLPLAGAGAAAPAAAAAQPAPATPLEAWMNPALGASTLDELRRAAATGNVDAAIVVASRLLDHFEQGGPVDDLYEATIWIDRYHGNEIFADASLIPRIRQRDCHQKVLRYHWLCEIGE